MNTCPDQETLHRYLEGALDADQLLRLNEHVANCGDCLKALDRETELSGLLATAFDSARRQALPTPSRIPVIAGFHIYEQIGAGGHGLVYRALNERTNRIVAVKILRAGPAATEPELKRFRVHVDALAKLAHPNITQLYSAGEYSGHPYLEMEYANGGSLDRILKETLPSERETAWHLRELSKGIQHAHDQCVLHRDLKPANILVTYHEDSMSIEPLKNATLKVTDYSVGKLMEGEEQLTPSEAILGTPQYMAPELALGKSKTSTIAADVYGLGAIGYEMLTKQPPFRGATPYDTLKLVCERDPQPLRALRGELSRDIENIILKCLEKEPNRRYESAEALANDLDRLLAGKAVLARPLGVFARCLRIARRHPLPTSLAVLLMIVILTSIISLTRLLRRADSALEKAGLEAERAEKRLTIALESLSAFKVSAGKRMTAQEFRYREDREALLKLDDLFTQIANDFPNDPEKRHDAAYSILQIAEMLSHLGDSDLAIPRSEKGMLLLRALVADYPSVPRYRSSLSEGIKQVTGHRQAAGLYDGNLDYLLEATALAEGLADEFPGSDHYRGVRSSFRLALGDEYLRRNNVGQGLLLIEKSLVDARELYRKYPHDLQRRIYFRDALGAYAAGLRTTGSEPTVYLKTLEEILADFEGTLKHGNTSKDVPLENYIYYYVRAAVAFSNTGNESEAERLMNAIGILSKKMVDDQPESHYYRIARARYLEHEGYRRISKGDHSGHALLVEAKTNYDKYLNWNTTQNLATNREQASHLLMVLQEHQDAPRAVAIIQRVLISPGANACDWGMLGIAHYECGRIDDAKAAFISAEKAFATLLRGEYTIQLYCAMTDYKAGLQGKAKEQLLRIHQAMRHDYGANWAEWRVFDRAWKMIEGNEPPKRSPAYFPSR